MIRTLQEAARRIKCIARALTDHDRTLKEVVTIFKVHRQRRTGRSQKGSVHRQSGTGSSQKGSGHGQYDTGAHQYATITPLEV